ncbi:hypothetical protein ACVWYI_002892 [Bradyrhizobium sp. LB13.1]
MDDAVDALADRLDLRHVGEVRRLELLVRAEVGGRADVAEQQVRIDRRQQFSQARSNPARSSRHQDARHVFPRMCDRFAAVDI